MKDDSGSYALFTEQGSSASQMTAAKAMDIISRHPGCSGQAADAVSAYTQVKMEDASKLFKIPMSEMWETQRNNANQDCFKTPILQETMKTQKNQHPEEFCACLEVIRLCQ